MPKSILYIEDESFIGRTIINKLKENGFEAEIAADGESAFEMMKEKKFDLILLDLILPKMSGFDVLKKLKEDATTKTIPVVVFSNQSTHEDKDRARDLGALDFRVKVNSTPNEVLALARTILQ
ncbi:MAG: response regulator [Patescibacteria group bacterium]